jgi:hypothetical protein
MDAGSPSIGVVYREIFPHELGESCRNLRYLGGPMFPWRSPVALGPGRRARTISTAGPGTGSRYSARADGRRAGRLPRQRGDSPPQAPAVGRPRRRPGQRLRASTPHVLKAEPRTGRRRRRERLRLDAGLAGSRNALKCPATVRHKGHPSPVSVPADRLRARRHRRARSHRPTQRSDQPWRPSRARVRRSRADRHHATAPAARRDTCDLSGSTSLREAKPIRSRRLPGSRARQTRGSCARDHQVY